MKKILLPSKVFEHTLYELICHLGDTDNANRIEVDFAYVNYYVPAAIVSLLTRFNYWQSKGKKVSIVNYESCHAYGYLQRIDFFKHCGFELEENFQRHPPAGRFVPVREVHHDTDKLATELATCIEPNLAELDDIEQTGLFDYFEYSISELGLNFIQHAGKGLLKGKAFASAQYVESSDKVRVAIADSGIGIRNSFKETGSPHYSVDLDDIGAIKKALEPKVSSSSHLAWGESSNMGVGLTVLSDTIKKLGGKFIIVSGEGFLSSSGEEYLLNEFNSFDGTLFSFMFTRDEFKKFNNHQSLLTKSKRDLGLIKDLNKIRGTFE
uniref:hypothetical protein n=1 Tax=Candidatus Electrothrix sp. TaxID=2170559 RepID=UPI00405752F8